MKYILSILSLYVFVINKSKCESELPLVINTWAFLNATEKAWETLFENKSSPLDAVEQGCSICESLQCDGTVGYGGSPDEDGETTLDAMIMNGADLNIGAVADLRRIKSAISVARRVLQNTQHTLIVGEQATKFAVQMGFTEESLETHNSSKIWKDWVKNKCQPNFWTNVKPDHTQSCGPYHPALFFPCDNDIPYDDYSPSNHDTIGMIAIDAFNNIAAGTSTNGARHKIPGRVGDSPIPGAGAYADNDIGAAVATGDGDIMMRLLPSFLAVEEMRLGKSPTESARIAIKRITDKYPKFFGGLIAVNKWGAYGAACNGMDTFPFAVRNLKLGKVTLKNVTCLLN